MTEQTLLLWLVAYAGLFAIVGFGLFVTRGFSGRDWSNRSLLRAASAAAFVLSTASWVAILLAD